VGAEPGQLLAVQTFRPLAGIVAATINPFIALDSRLVHPTTHKDGELIEAVEFRLDQVYAMLEQGLPSEATHVVKLLRARPVFTKMGFLR